MSEGQSYTLNYDTDRIFPPCRKGFSAIPERLSGVTEGCVPACGNGVLESRERLFRTTERTCAPAEWVRMRFLYGFSAFAFPVSRFCFVKIFYCQNRIFMHSGMHRAIVITSLPAQWRQPSRDAKCCVSQANHGNEMREMMWWGWMRFSLGRRKILHIYFCRQRA